MSLADFATRFAISLHGVCSVLVGIDRPAYLEAAVAVGEAGPLTPGQVRDARGLAFPEPERLDLHDWDIRGWLK